MTSSAIWESIKGYEGYYEASPVGHIRSLKRFIIKKNGIKQIVKGRILTPFPKRGYLCASLTNGKVKHILIHRLIAETFIPNPLNKPCVNHIDGNKQNNGIDNLEWCTYSENTIHSYIILKRKASQAFLGRTGSMHPRSRKIICINNSKIYCSLNDAARDLNLLHSKISLVCSGIRPHTKGYVFEYLINHEQGKAVAI